MTAALDAVTVQLPSSLREHVGGAQSITVSPAPADVCALLDSLALTHPVLERRLRDETGAIRRYVNVYVDGDDIRRAQGVATPVVAGITVQILPSIAGG